MIPTDLLPEYTVWCIAGGWAACPALASNKDVWVFITELAEGWAYHRRDELLKHLEVKGFVFLAEDETREAPSYEGVIGIMKVAKVDMADAGVIHLLITNARDIHSLLCSFDISTHQIALSSQGVVIKGNDFTPITQPPVKLLDTPATDAHMSKIAARYGHVLPEVITT